MLLAYAMTFSGLFMALEITKINKYMSRFLAFVPLFFLFVLIGFNRMSRDYTAYEYAFISLPFRQTLESGYVFLIETVSRFGGSHDTIVFFTAVLFLFILIKLLGTSSYINLVVFCYCAYPLMYDITQTRNFLMYLLVTVSLFFAASKKPIKHYVTLIIASTMHTLAFIYLPFYFLCKFSNKRFVRVMIYTTVALFVVSPWTIEILKIIFPAKMLSYLPKKPGLGILINYISTFADIFTVWWVYKRVEDKLSESDSKLMLVFYRFVWYPLLALPFAHYFLEVARVQRNSLLVKYIFVAMAMKYLAVKQRIFVVLLLSATIIFYFLTLDYVGNWDLVEYLDYNSLKYFFDGYSFF